MLIGLIDVDGHNYPNLPLMKISAWHKKQEDIVKWYEPLFDSIGTPLDKVYNYYNSFNNGGCRERQTLYDEYILKDISLTLAMILDEIGQKHNDNTGGKKNNE